MYFDKIIGHEPLKERIQKALSGGHLAHAYIFEGVRGVGKSMTAEALAAALLCETQETQACGVCPACLKMASSNHPDYTIVVPDGASIKNKQIEFFQEFIQLKPFTGNRKIAVIKEAHLMTLSAQNRILKVLEEPPKYAVIIFITNQMASMLPTIKSRCQCVSFQRLQRQMIQDYLVSAHNIEPTQAEVFAAFADGSIGRAKECIEDEAFIKLREDVTVFAQNLVMRRTSKGFEWTSEMESQKEKLDQVFDLMKLWFRDIMMIKNGVDAKLLFNVDQLEDLQRISYRLSLTQIITTLERIEQARAQLASHVNVGLLLETLILDIQEGM